MTSKYSVRVILGVFEEGVLSYIKECLSLENVNNQKLGVTLPLPISIGEHSLNILVNQQFVKPNSLGPDKIIVLYDSEISNAKIIRTYFAPYDALKQTKNYLTVNDEKVEKGCFKIILTPKLLTKLFNNPIKNPILVEKENEIIKTYNTIEDLLELIIRQQKLLLRGGDYLINLSNLTELINQLNSETRNFKNNNPTNFYSRKW